MGVLRMNEGKVKRMPYLTPGEIITLLKQQEMKVRELARLIKLVPWTAEEFDTDSTVPHEKFATPITVKTGGDWWKPDYHFVDAQGDNEGVLPPGVQSVLKVHGKDVYRVEVEFMKSPASEFRNTLNRLGIRGMRGDVRNITVPRRKLMKLIAAIQDRQPGNK